MKKQYKEPLKQALVQFLEMNNFIIHRGFSSKSRIQKKSKDTDDIKNYLVDDFLFKDTIPLIDKKENLYGFMDFLLAQPNLREAGFSFIVSKTPGDSNPEYREIINNYLKVLSPYKEELFNYISRPQFLKVNLGHMPSIMEQYIDQQDKREAIVEMYCSMPSFNNSESHRQLYNLIEDFLVEKNQYKTLLTKFKPDSSVNLIKKERTYSAYCFTVSAGDLVQINPKIDNKRAISLTYKFNDLENYMDKLGLQEIKVNKLNDATLARDVTYFGENLNVPFLKEFSEKYLKLHALGHFEGYDSEDLEFSSLINELVSETLHSVLQEKIPQSTVKTKKKKL